MDFEVELKRLHEMINENFMKEVDGESISIEHWNLPPSIHSFRFRARFFLLEFGVSDSNMEEVKIECMAPWDIWRILEGKYINPLMTIMEIKKKTLRM